VHHDLFETEALERVAEDVAVDREHLAYSLVDGLPLPSHVELIGEPDVADAVIPFEKSFEPLEPRRPTVPVEKIADGTVNRSAFALGIRLELRPSKTGAISPLVKYLHTHLR